MAVNLPVDVRALYDAGKRLKQDREQPVRIAVLVEIDAPDALVEAAREELRPKTSNGLVDVSVIEPGKMLRVDAKADAAIVLVGSGAHVTPTLADLRERALPTAVLAIREDRSALARLLGHPENDVLVGMDAGELIRGPLADWTMSHLEKLRTALGNNFEFVRRAAAKETVKKTAWQNAAVGAVMFIPGADMPIMTLNQGKMLLQIAAAYGQPLDTERIKELAAVVAGGFLFRTFARELVGLIPGFGWAVKGGIAYTGTIAMGTAAIGYFEEGADLPGVVKALTERAGEAASRVAEGVRSRGGRVEAALEDSAPTGYVPTAAPGQQALLEVPPVVPTLAPGYEPSDRAGSGDAGL
jgi:uncharacterized protein (DUF697 family)